MSEQSKAILTKLGAKGEKVSLEVLREMRVLLAPPEAFTQGAYARDINGRKCAPLAPAAVCWCLHGAHSRVDNWVHASHWDLDLALDPWLPPGAKDPVSVNDQLGHGAILALLDAAISSRLATNA